MRILFIQATAGPGGSKSSLLTALESLAAAHSPAESPVVLCGEEGPFVDQCRDLGVAVRVARLPAWRKLLDRLRFRRLTDRAAANLPPGPFHAVVANELRWAPHAYHLGRRLGAVSAAIIRDTNAVGPRAGQYGLHRLDRVLCVSAALRHGLARQGVPPARLCTVYNPIRPPAVENIPTPGWRRRGIDRWLGYVGDVTPRKNQLDAVRALHHLRERSGAAWGLVLAGETHDADYLAELEAEIARLHLHDAVAFAGHVTPIGAFLAHIDALVLTSVREGLSRSLAEALIAGLPAFSFRLDGVEELYGEFHKCFVPTSNTPEALAVRIIASFEASAVPHATQMLAARLRQRHDPDTYPQRLVESLRKTASDALHSSSRPE